MSYSIACECSRAVSVASAQAGTQIHCSCGLPINVPRLSELRQLAGEGSYEAGIIDTINRMVEDGELPAGDSCVISGTPTSDCYDLIVECESTWMKGPGTKTRWFVFVSILFLPFRFFWILFGKDLLDEEQQEHGHERSVCTPLRVDKGQHDVLLRTKNQRKLRAMLKTVPIYEELLTEYPEAKISV